MVFGLLRNFVLVGLLKYFLREERQPHPLLYPPISSVRPLSYVDQWYVNLFGFLGNKTLAHRLNLVLNVLFTVVLFVSINRATELSRAHAS